MTDLARIEGQIGLPLTLVKEGAAVVAVPDLNLAVSKKRIEPAWLPVFYNPVMKISRDIDTLFLSMTRPGITFCEPLCATGIRSIRYILETDNIDKAVLCDKNYLASRLTWFNVSLNLDFYKRKKVKVVHGDANLLLRKKVYSKEFFDVIDLDPFGSPAPFLESAISALKNQGILMATATDLGPLTGINHRACIRKYFSNPLRTSYSRELGARILIGFICRIAARNNVGIEPLLTYSSRHFIRVIVKTVRKVSASDKSLENIGVCLHCYNCGYRRLEREFLPKISRCPICNEPLSYAGPLWIGNIQSRPHIEELLAISSRSPWRYSKEAISLIQILAAEAGLPPLFVTVDEISKMLRAREISPDKLISVLVKEGYKASRTHFNRKGVRTDAPFSTVIKLAKSTMN